MCDFHPLVTESLKLLSACVWASLLDYNFLSYILSSKFTQNAPDISEIRRICPTEGGFRADCVTGTLGLGDQEYYDIWHTWLSTTSLNTIGFTHFTNTPV